MKLEDHTVRPRSEMPQCSAGHTETKVSIALGGAANRAKRLERAGRDPNRCGRGSSYRIDGVWYCNIHAGKVALTELLRQQGEES